MAESSGQQPENRSSITTILLITGAFMAIYYGYQHFFGTTPPPPVENGSTAQHADLDASAIAELRRARVGQREEATIRTDLYEATFDNLTGGLTSFRMLGERFHTPDGEQEELVTTGRVDGQLDVRVEDYLPLRISIPGVELPPDIVWDISEEPVSEALPHGAVRMSWTGNGVEVVRRIEPGTAPYQLYQTVRVRNLGTTSRRLRVQTHLFHYVPRALESTGVISFGARSNAISQGICRHDEEVERKPRGDLASAHGYGGVIDFTALENVYFVQAIAPGSDSPAERCGLWATDRFPNGSTEADGTLFEAQLRYPIVDLAPGSETITRTMAYVGPKEWSALEHAGHSLQEVVNLGFFAVIARFFAQGLSLLHGFTGNWGLAIIILTMFVRLALYPVMARQFKSFAPMRKLKPEMDKINAQFSGDMERRNAAVMELYKKHGINPAAQMLGCLPVLLQMPVFFALYTSLSTNIELYHQPFALWWTDLSAPDRFFSLPIALSAVMWLQQRLTPTQMDPAQQRIMMWMMPIMMGAFMLFLPSGLCLYMLTNSTLSIAQQRFNEWNWQRAEAAKAATVETQIEPAKPSDTGTSSRGAEAKTTSRRPPRG